MQISTSVGICPPPDGLLILMKYWKKLLSPLPKVISFYAGPLKKGSLFYKVKAGLTLHGISQLRREDNDHAVTAKTSGGNETLLVLYVF